jgi:hypothetical protein
VAAKAHALALLHALSDALNALVSPLFFGA